MYFLLSVSVSYVTLNWESSYLLHGVCLMADQSAV